MTSRQIFIGLSATLLAGLALAANSISPVAKKFLYATGMAFRGLTPRQIESVVAITEAFRKYGDGDHRKLAYMLALAWHESRLQPIKEIRAAPGTEVYNIQNRYWGTGYYGRGYVQITWDKNYAKFSKLVGVDLVRNPDAALVPSIAARIIVIGMMQGMFTGRKLSDYINGNTADYYNARRTVGAINVAGTDTAALIVGHLKKLFHIYKSTNTMRTKLTALFAALLFTLSFSFSALAQDSLKQRTGATHGPTQTALVNTAQTTAQVSATQVQVSGPVDYNNPDSFFDQGFMGTIYAGILAIVSALGKFIPGLRKVSTSVKGGKLISAGVTAFLAITVLIGFQSGGLTEKFFDTITAQFLPNFAYAGLLYSAYKLIVGFFKGRNKEQTPATS